MIFNDIRVGQLWKHHRNEQTYIVIEVDAKMRLDDIWVPCVIYRQLGGTSRYVRTRTSFLKSFTLQPDQ